MKRSRSVVTMLTGFAMALALTGFAVSSGEILGNEAGYEEPTTEEVVVEKASYEKPEETPTVEEEPVIKEIVEEEVPEEEIPEYTEYIVQAGDSLWSIAQEHYGSGTLYGALAAYNEISTAAVIHPGDVLKIKTDEIEAVAVSYSAPTINEPIQEPEPTPVTYNSSIGYGANSFDGEMGVDEAVAVIKDQPNLDTTGMTYMGNWRITGYDPHCDHCCGKHNGITASGNQAEFGVTAGCNNLPLGTKIYVEGYGVFRVDDRGGMSKNHIDIAAPSHDACYQMTGYANVYVISYPD